MQNRDKNKSAADYIAPRMKEQTVNTTMVPSIDRIGDDYVIQCFGTNLTLGIDTIGCWPEPMLQGGPKKTKTDFLCHKSGTAAKFHAFYTSNC